MGGIRSVSTYITDMKLPNTIQEIGDGAFSGCYLLENINIPESVKSIGDGAFSGCSSLKSINIPKALVSIGSRAFERCISFQEIEIPNEIPEIGESPFLDCFEMKKIVAPFKMMPMFDPTSLFKLESIILTTPIDGDISDKNYYNKNPKFLKLIYSNSIKEIVVSASDEAYCSVDGIIYSKDTTSLVLFPRGKDVADFVVDYPTTQISANAFSWCEQLQDLTIGSAVLEIGAYAFCDCHHLESIQLKDGIERISYDAFANCSKLRNIEIPRTVKSIDKDCFKRCDSLVSVRIMGESCSLAQGAFENCSLLEYLEINGGRINSHTTFENAVNLKYIKLGQYFSMQNYLAELVFASSPMIEEVEIDCEIGTLGMFRNKERLEKVIIGNSVTVINAHAFEGCYALSEVWIGNSVASIADEAFMNCSSLKDMYISSIVPPLLGTNALPTAYGTRGNDNTLLTIHVPFGCKNAYESAEGWSNYNIVEEAPLTVHDITSNSLYNKSSLFDLQGKRVLKMKRGGIYIKNKKKIKL